MDFVSPPTPVLVLMAEEPLDGAMAAAADQHGWCRLEPQTVPQALKQIRAHKPCVCVVPLVAPAGPGTHLIRVLRTYCREVPVVAVAVRHSPELEVSVRQAGATGYVPDADDGDRLRGSELHTARFSGRGARGSEATGTIGQEFCRWLQHGVGAREHPCAGSGARNA